MRKFWIGIIALLLACVAVHAQEQNAQTEPPASSSSKPSAQAATAAAQKTAQSTDSLVEAAKKAREQKKADTKPAKVWDNDSIPAISGAVASAAAPNSSDAASEETKAPATTSVSGDPEKMWRSRFAKAHEKLDKDQQDLDLLQREMGQLSVQFYANPVEGMQQGYSQSDLNNQRAKIDTMQKQVEADKQAITDLEDELRKAGGDPGWAR